MRNEISHTAEQLLQQPEGKTLEFKRDLSSPRNLLKTLVAFANSAGGNNCGRMVLTDGDANARAVPTSANSE